MQDLNERTPEIALTSHRKGLILIGVLAKLLPPVILHMAVNLATNSTELATASTELATNSTELATASTELATASTELATASSL